MKRKPKKKLLTGTQTDIIRAMLKSKRPQSAYKISKKSHKAWGTVKSNLRDLELKKAVRKISRENKVKWEINLLSKKKKTVRKRKQA